MTEEVEESIENPATNRCFGFQSFTTSSPSDTDLNQSCRDFFDRSSGLVSCPAILTVYDDMPFSAKNCPRLATSSGAAQKP